MPNLTSLDRMAQLAGLPDHGDAADLPPMGGAYVGQDDGFGMDDAIGDHLGMSDHMAAVSPDMSPEMPQSMPVANAGPVVSPTMTIVNSSLDTIDNALAGLTMSDFKFAIQRLRDITASAERMRADFLAEDRRIRNRKPLSRYMQEATGDMTIGGDRNDAIDAIGDRMGKDMTKPADKAEAQKSFDKLRQKGKLRQDGTDFKMATMDDGDFAKTLAEDATEKCAEDDAHDCGFAHGKANKKPNPPKDDKEGKAYWRGFKTAQAKFHNPNKK